MSRNSPHLWIEKYPFLVIIFSTLCYLIFVNCFFVPHAYASFDTKSPASHFERKIEYALSQSTDNDFTLHYVVSGGYAGSLNISKENITYNSKINEISGTCITDSVNKTLSDSEARNLELMIDQNKDLFTTNKVYPSKGADKYNHNLTVINEGSEHYTTWMSTLDIPANLTKIAKEIHGLACTNLKS